MKGRRLSVPGNPSAGAVLLLLIVVMVPVTSVLAADPPERRAPADCSAPQSQPALPLLFGMAESLFAFPGRTGTAHPDQDSVHQSSHNAALDQCYFEEVQHLEAGHRLRKLASGVGKLEIRIDGQSEWLDNRCTAFLISTQYLLTAYHCLTSRFHPYEQLTIAGVRLRLGFLSSHEPGIAWQVDPEPIDGNFSDVANLDYIILRILPDRWLGPPTTLFSAVPLAAHDPEPGTDLFIVHHPYGANQRWTARGCRVADERTNVSSSSYELPHICDVRHGSSGAPIFSAESAAVVALHHIGINRWQVNYAIRTSAIASDSDVVAGLVGASDTSSATVLQNSQGRR